jgi:hypothetical protein
MRMANLVSLLLPMPHNKVNTRTVTGPLRAHRSATAASTSGQDTTERLSLLTGSRGGGGVTASRCSAAVQG